MNVVSFLLLALSAALLNVPVFGRAEPGAAVRAAKASLGEVCQKPGVHCLFTGPGISVSGSEIIDNQRQASGSAIYEHSPKPGRGTATGCGGSTVSWSFNGSIGVFDGGSSANNQKIQGYFLSQPRNVAKNGILGIKDAGADLNLACS